MAKYAVDIKEVHTRQYIVEAASEDEAREKANQELENGKWYGPMEYSHTEDVADWNVERLSAE